MKIKSLLQSAVFALTAFTFLSACSNNERQDTAHSSEHAGETSKNESAVKEAPEPQFKVDEQFQKQLSAVVTSYHDLHEAFVASRVQEVQEEASETTEALGKVDMTLVSGAAHNDWMSYLSPMQNALKEIASSEDLETQRQSFSTLSENLYKSARAFGLAGQEAFYTYCPMAFDNEGAYWLSATTEVRNPYFGDKMLSCGEVKEKIN